jgi:acylphosphatase
LAEVFTSSGKLLRFFRNAECSCTLLFVMADIVLRLEIRGLVQGVGFRWSMAEEARQLGILGWVRNRRDGSVEAMVKGPAAAVDRIVAWARRGPGAAVVDTVDVFEGEGAFDAFDQWPTR